MSFSYSIDNGWSIANAMKEAPKIVSGLVVNTVIFFLLSLISKFNSHPVDFPIQFFCIILTFSGHSSSVFSDESNSSANAVILKNH